MNSCTKLLLAGLMGGCCSAMALAADLRAMPVVVEPLAGSRTTSITLINDEARPLKAQIRVMRWSQQNGQDVLTPTDDVVASPPLALLNAGQHYLVRLVRTAKAPPVGEETYRVLIDELPDPTNIKPGAVDLVLRQSIPVFFSDTPRRASKVDWNVTRSGTSLWLVAKNTGNRRLRLSELNFDVGGTPIYTQPGLIGYVLSGAEMRWAITPSAPLPAGGKLHMKATADTGPLDVALVAKSGI